MAAWLNGAASLALLRAIAVFIDPDPPIFDFLDREPPPYPFLTKLRQRLREESAGRVSPSSWEAPSWLASKPSEETTTSFTLPEPPLTIALTPIEDSTGEVEKDSPGAAESSTIVPVETTTTLTVTPTAAPWVASTHTEDSANVGPGDQERSCDWLFKYTIDNSLEGLHKFLSEFEASSLIGAAFEARRLRGELLQGEDWGWLKGRQLYGLDEVLSFLITAPLWKICEALRGLVDQAAASGNKAAQLVPLLDDALAELSEKGLGTGDKLKPGMVPVRAVPALRFVVEGRGEGDKYCIGDDCNIPAQIYNMWQRTEKIRRILRTKLRAIREDLTGTRSLWSILMETLVLLPVLIIILTAARLVF